MKNTSVSNLMEVFDYYSCFSQKMVLYYLCQTNLIMQKPQYLLHRGSIPFSTHRLSLIKMQILILWV